MHRGAPKNATNGNQPGVRATTTSPPAGQRKTPPTDELYARDRSAFENWCVQQGVSPRADVFLVARYIDWLSEQRRFRYTTIERIAYGLSGSYRTTGAVRISRQPAFRDALQRAHISAKARQRTKGLTRSGLRAVVVSLDQESVAATRDRALLSLGHAGGFKPGALARMARGDVSVHADCVLVVVREKSKSIVVTVPASAEELIDPRRALEHWLDVAEHQSSADALWRRVTKDDRFRNGGLSAQAITRMVQRRCWAAGIVPEELSAGCLRNGAALELGARGLDAAAIAQRIGYTRRHRVEPLLRELKCGARSVLIARATF